MKIAVIGTGYVGLVAGAGFADFGNEVVCVDTDAAKIDALRHGEVPIYEPGLEDLVQRNLLERRLLFTTDGPAAVRAAEVVIIAVGTPSRPNGAADTTAVMDAARMIGANLGPHFTTVVIKSTVPVGTRDKVYEEIRRVGDLFDVASNPEFLKEGDAVSDFMRPDRIVVGVVDEHAEAALRKLYSPFTRTYDRLLVTSPRSAELTKYACNAYLATRISFMNEIANLCSALGADVDAVRRGMGTDPRIGPRFLFPGVGYGGSCFPKDVSALVHLGQGAGSPCTVAQAAREVNREQKLVHYRKARGEMGKDLRAAAVWGLAFKPRTDDIREAPAVALVEALLADGVEVRVHDPVAGEAAARRFEDRVTVCDNPYDAAAGCDALFICTEWPQFRTPDWDRLRKSMMPRAPRIYDGRNVLDPAEVEAAGFVYRGVGRCAR